MLRSWHSDILRGTAAVVAVAAAVVDGNEDVGVAAVVGEVPVAGDSCAGDATPSGIPL